MNLPFAVALSNGCCERLHLLGEAVSASKATKRLDDLELIAI